VFEHYPELASAISDICDGRRWGVTGVSALVHDERSLYFEITKPKHWCRLPSGEVRGGIGAIGGSLELGEELLECLDREMLEEIGCTGVVESRRRVFLVYEEQTIEQRDLGRSNYPGPVVLTIGRNIHRRTDMADRDILVIVTFLARLWSVPAPDDLFGLLSIPRDRAKALLTADRITVGMLRSVTGARLVCRSPLSPDMQLVPVWTARSLQVLAQHGLLAETLG